MINKKQVKWILLSFLLFLFINLYLTSSYTLSFIDQSVATKAKVVAVDKKSIGYNATVRFLTSYETILDADMFSLTAPVAGQVVDIKYNRVIPVQLTKDSFFEIWFSTILIISLILLAAILFYVIKVCSGWKKNRNKKMRQAGNHIYTTFKAVEAVLKVKKEGRHPYQIISSWHDIKANKTYYFKSDYIWKNPVDYILDKTIKVIIDNKSKKKYIMDLNFLPENFR